MNVPAQVSGWRDRPWWNTNGVLVVITTSRVTVRGELMTADSSGVAVLSEDAELVWVDRRAVNKTELPGLMPAFSLTYRSTVEPMRGDVLNQLRQLSRFPLGLEGAALESVLRFTGQTEILRIDSDGPIAQ
jgi:hypothetical protein